jgi:hypothetical protein
MESNLNDLGGIIEYNILPVNKKVRLKLVDDKTTFNSVLIKYKGESTTNIYGELKKDTLFVKKFPMFGYHAERDFYTLSNNLLAVDQSKLKKSNPYYICETFEDFKLIAQYLNIFRVEANWNHEVQCSIHEHFEIKKFLEREKEHLEFIDKMSDGRFKLFIANDGKCIYINYWGNTKGKWLNTVNSFKRDGVDWYSYEEIENENEFYWGLVIYESMEKLKLHNVGL